MNYKPKRIVTAAALFLVFSVTQVYVGVSFAGPQPTVAVTAPAAAAPQQVTGILTTESNKSIIVNGATAISGATVLNGATIETPEGVGATVSLGSMGEIKIDPNTRLKLEFVDGKITITVLQGCVNLHTRKGTSGELDNGNGTPTGKTTSTKDGVVSYCTAGAIPTAATAGGAAGAGAAAGGGLFGLGTAATVAIIAGGATAVIVPIALRGSNPSPSAP
jgi:hypothetical protein